LATLWREARSALGSARAQYAAATASLHARAETVRSGTLEFAGLKCTFHVKRLDTLVCRFQQGATIYW